MTKRNLLYVVPTGIEDTQIPDVRVESWLTHQASNSQTAMGLLSKLHPRVGLVLLQPRPQGGIQAWIRDLVASPFPIEWIAVVPKAGLQDAELCTLIREYFFDYHTLPIFMPRLQMMLGHAYGMAELACTTSPSPDEIPNQYGMCGASSAMMALYRQIAKIAPIDAPVLITGETGTGKELVARALHANSPRAAGPFVALNCATLPSELIQDEFFGHEKGAFTGAYEQRIGRIESATGGTLFLDEVGDLSESLQASLLRVLQEKTIFRLGGTQDIFVDVRMIAATPIDLEAAVQEGRFRKDLFQQLNVLRLHTPSVRERNADSRRLARFFLEKFAKESKSTVKGFTRQALEVIDSYDWPGNVREIMNRVRKAVVLAEEPFLSPADLGLEKRSPRRRLITLEEAREAAEKEAVLAALRRTRHNISRAARELKVSRVTLYRLMDKYGVRGYASNTNSRKECDLN